MDLASYYQGLFIQSSGQHEDIRAGHARFGNFSTFFTPSDPCWDLDSLHEEEIYRFSNTNYNSSYCKSSPLNSSSDLSDACLETRPSGPISTTGDIGMCTPSSESYLQSYCLLPSLSTENEGAAIADDKVSTTMPLERSPHTSTKEKPRSKKTGTRSRSKANARERKRMNRINDGFQELRLKLPGRSSQRELSKIEALQVAHSYILQLAALLQSSPV